VSETFVLSTSTQGTASSVRSATPTKTSEKVTFRAPEGTKRHPRDERDIRAVYDYIQRVRALGLTTINTLEIANALNLSTRRVEVAVRALASKGVKVKR